VCDAQQQTSFRRGASNFVVNRGALKTFCRHKADIDCSSCSMMRADLRKCEGNTGGSSAHRRTASSSSPSFAGVPSQLDHTSGGRVLELPDILSQVAGRVFVPLGIKGQSWNRDLARDHSYWVLPRPNDLCYAGPIGRSAASPEICFAASEPGAALHQSKASREFEPDNIPRPQNGQGPGAP
jgi:hypothetical protein